MVINPIRYKKKERQKQKKCNNKNTVIVRKPKKKQTMQARKLNRRRGLRKQERKMKMVVFTCPTLLLILKNRLLCILPSFEYTYNHLPKGLRIQTLQISAHKDL